MFNATFLSITAVPNASNVRTVTVVGGLTMIRSKLCRAQKGLSRPLVTLNASRVAADNISAAPNVLPVQLATSVSIKRIPSRANRAIIRTMRVSFVSLAHRGTCVQIRKRCQSNVHPVTRLTMATWIVTSFQAGSHLTSMVITTIVTSTPSTHHLAPRCAIQWRRI